MPYTANEIREKLAKNDSGVNVVITCPFISRELVQANPDWYFVFGDNLRREGLGGQAAAMRHEPNAVGIATKRAPGTDDDDYFSDDCEQDIVLSYVDCQKLATLMETNRVIVLPTEPLGSGLSELDKRAPSIYGAINATIDALKGVAVVYEMLPAEKAN